MPFTALNICGCNVERVDGIGSGTRGLGAVFSALFCVSLFYATMAAIFCVVVVPVCDGDPDIRLLVLVLNIRLVTRVFCVR